MVRIVEHGQFVNVFTNKIEQIRSVSALVRRCEIVLHNHHSLFLGQLDQQNPTNG